LVLLLLATSCYGEGWYRKSYCKDNKLVIHLYNTGRGIIFVGDGIDFLSYEVASVEGLIVSQGALAVKKMHRSEDIDKYVMLIPVSVDDASKPSNPLIDLNRRFTYEIDISDIKISKNQIISYKFKLKYFNVDEKKFHNFEISGTTKKM